MRLWPLGKHHKECFDQLKSIFTDLKIGTDLEEITQFILYFSFEIREADLCQLYFF
jgi:hypothetical protein